MKIKRTTAPDMRTAMKLIREEQGPDAVILGNRKVPGGIEIVSAVDYEAGAVDSQSLFTDVKEQASETDVPPLHINRPDPSPVLAPEAPGRWDAHNKDDLDEAERSVRRATELLRAARASGKSTNNQVSEPAPTREPEPKSIPVEKREHRRASETPHQQAVVQPNVAAVPANTQISEMHLELKAMRELMSQQLDVMGWGNMTRRQPAKVNLLTRLHHLGLGTELALELCSGVDSATDPALNWRDALKLLQNKIPESREDMIEHGGVFALMGTTGVGKTTTIAKLAALCALQHGKHSVALISTDNMRVGAREQLRSFAAILDVPLVFCENDEQLEREVQRLRDRKLVLVDTAGLGIRDARIGQSLAQVRRVKAIQPVLTLAADTQLGAMEESCRVFSNCDPVGCIVSKVDEAYSLGAVMTALVEHKLPLMWFGSGQRVPEDLSRASTASLMRLALGTEALKKSSLLDADELASLFGRAKIHESV